MSPGAHVPELVSVIVPVRNRPRMLVEAVESVLAQGYRPLEVVIVDDASTDTTPESIADLERRAQGLVRGIRRAQPGGPGAARESGRLAIRGAYVQHLDSDDLLLPGKLEAQVSVLRARPELALVYGDVEERLEVPGTTPRTRTRHLPTLERGFPALLVERVWHTFLPLYRREAIDEAGAWLPLCNEEDWEYDARIAAQGRPIAKVQAVVGVMRRHGEGHASGSASHRRRTLHHQALARELILSHALRAGVPRESPELQHAVRALFLLSRQCGAAGLVEDSERLFGIVRRMAPAPEAYDLKGYAAVARLTGWRPAGVLAAALDRVRRAWRE